MKTKTLYAVIAILLLIVAYLVFRNGRYSIVTAPNIREPVYILDTRTGELWMKQGYLSVSLGKLDKQPKEVIEKAKQKQKEQVTSDSSENWWNNDEVVQ